VETATEHPIRFAMMVTQTTMMAVLPLALSNYIFSALTQIMVPKCSAFAIAALPIAMFVSMHLFVQVAVPIIVKV
jgi:hypothetical protein